MLDRARQLIMINPLGVSAVLGLGAAMVVLYLVMMPIGW